MGRRLLSISTNSSPSEYSNYRHINEFWAWSIAVVSEVFRGGHAFGSDHASTVASVARSSGSYRFPTDRNRENKDLNGCKRSLKWNFSGWYG
ncbi:hypothetical protein CEXT_174991 [Caerostris extrusa]|uniref:Uncharacterized protein n=1 Tax=Caerostris extrusa TaxID=172846 RepID=A0AAV4UXD5_CAEEX|nr:hypothetical protein CEXT_174991 [Caerostris extrusa]